MGWHCSERLTFPGNINKNVTQYDCLEPCLISVKVSRWGRFWRVSALWEHTEVCSCKCSHAKATVTQPQGSGKGWKEYTPCLLERFYSGIPHITLQSTVTQPAVTTAGCRGPLVAMCWAPSPLYCKHAVIHGSWSPTSVSYLLLKWYIIREWQASSRDSQSEDEVYKADL